MTIEQVWAWLGVTGWVEFWWVVFGVFGQFLFMSRFLVQWIASERAKRSVIPIAFWYLSIAGALTLFAYAVHRGDPVFILGQSLGIFIYSRNLYLIQVEKKRHDGSV